MTTFTPGEPATVVCSLPVYAQTIEIPVKVVSVDQEEITARLDLEGFNQEARAGMERLFKALDPTTAPERVRLYFDPQTLYQIRTPKLGGIPIARKRLTKRVMPVGRDS